MARYVEESEIRRMIIRRGWMDEKTLAESSVVDDLPAADVRENVKKPIPGYEGLYSVDNMGRVFIDKTGKIMKQQLTNNGRKTVGLYKNGAYKTMFVHRLVAFAFIDNPDNLPCINHKDEDPTNNFVENLEWCTHKYNNSYGTAPKRRARKLRGRKRPDYVRENMKVKMKAYQNSEKGNGRPVVLLETGETFTSVCDAAEKFGINEATIRRSCQRKTAHGRNGKTFRYVEDLNCGAEMEMSDT